MCATLAPSAQDEGLDPANRTKSGQYDDCVFFGDAASQKAHRGFIARMVRKVRQKRSPLQRMWDLDITALSHHFQQAVQRTGLGQLRLTPHCTRHGAAPYRLSTGTPHAG